MQVWIHSIVAYRWQCNTPASPENRMYRFISKVGNFRGIMTEFRSKRFRCNLNLAETPVIAFPLGKCDGNVNTCSKVIFHISDWRKCDGKLHCCISVIFTKNGNLHFRLVLLKGFYKKTDSFFQAFRITCIKFYDKSPHYSCN